MSFLDSKMSVRMRKIEKERLEEISIKYPGLFDNPNHVARCAIMRFIKEEKKQSETWKRWFE